MRSKPFLILGTDALEGMAKLSKTVFLVCYWYKCQSICLAEAASDINDKDYCEEKKQDLPAGASQWSE